MKKQPTNALVLVGETSPPSRPDRKTRGARSKLTSALGARIVENLELGLPEATAACLAGISSATYYSWKALGRGSETTPPSPRHQEFLETVERAKAKSEEVLLRRILEASNVSWQAAAWLLERRFPQRYGRMLRVEGTQGGPVQINVILPDDLGLETEAEEAGGVE